MPHYFILLAVLLAGLCSSTGGANIPADFFSFSGGNNLKQPSGNGDDGSYYKTLGQGVNKQSNLDEIKKAYRKKAMQMHPDKGGDAEDFKSLTEAYEILSNPQKRALYDRYGVAGLGAGGGDSRSSASDMAREFFKGFGGFSAPLVFQLDLTLEDFYIGKEITIPIDSTQQVKVVVEPGMFGGQELVAQAEHRGMARDIILRLREIRHPIFLRKNADLLIDLKISITEALLGFDRTIKLLDGKEIKIQSPVGEVSGPDSVFVIPNYGMPVYRTMQKVKGRLFVRPKLEMPKKIALGLEDKVELERLLNLLDGSSDYSSRFSGPNDSDDNAEQAVKNNNRKSPESNAAIKLVAADIRSFGQFGGGPEDDDDDFQRSPFAQYFFR